MALVAPVDKNGNVIDPTSPEYNKNVVPVKKDNSSLGKDAFLQLLVAQMKYQDPLEPTSNTEFISQYATFSELEQMQNVSTNVNLQRASSLIGKYVNVIVRDNSGNEGYVYGKVDYVRMENDKAYLSVGGNEYSIDDLASVVDNEFKEATDKVSDFIEKLGKLPKVENISFGDEQAINEIIKIYEGLNDYEKSFVTKSIKDLYQKYVDKLAELKAPEKVAAFEERIKKLPGVDSITLDNEKEITELNSIYQKMTSHELKLVKKETSDLLKKYVEKIAELKK